MPWNLQLHHDAELIELTYSGIVTPDALIDAFTTAAKLAKENNILLFLADCLDMLGGHSVVDLYSLIALFETLDIAPRSREALILPNLKASLQDVSFYETACLNRGYNVKVFKARQEALAWLTEKPVPSAPEK